MLSARLARYYEIGGGASRIVPMEGVRGLAVLLVFFVHFHSLLGSYVAAGSASFAVSEFLGDVGNVGVDLFFVLSGYLIYGAVMTGRASYGRFMRRRVVRIYPAFLTVLAIYLALSLVVSGESKLPAGAWAAALYLAANVVLLPGMLPITPMVTVAWSLSYEMFYYLTIPLLVGAAGLRRWTATARIRFFVALLCFQLGLAFALGNALHVRLGMFIPGILLYEVLRLPARPALSRAGEGWACLLFVLSFVPAYWLTAPHTQLAFLPRVEPLRAGYKVMVLSITYLVFLLHVFVRGGLAARVFSWTPLRWLGNMSYSYYLIHGLTLKALAVAVMHVAPPAGHAPLFFWSLLPVGLLATLAVSTALFLGVEKPLSLGPVMPPRRAAPLGAAVEAAVVEAPAVETTAVR